MSVTDTSYPTPARPALVALAAIVLSWLAEIVAQVGYFGPGGEISLWGVQVAVAQSAVVVAGLVVGLGLIGRIDLLARMVTVLFLLVAVLNHPNANAGRPALDALVQWAIRDAPQK